MLWVVVLVALLVLIFYVRKEHLEPGRDDSKDSKDPESDKNNEGDEKSKDSDKSAKDSKDTTIIIVERDRDEPRHRHDPFYTMTDPYWATYNNRWGYSPRYAHPPKGPRRIW